MRIVFPVVHGHHCKLAGLTIQGLTLTGYGKHNLRTQLGGGLAQKFAVKQQLFGFRDLHDAAGGNRLQIGCHRQGKAICHRVDRHRHTPQRFASLVPQQQAADHRLAALLLDIVGRAGHIHIELQFQFHCISSLCNILCFHAERRNITVSSHHAADFRATARFGAFSGEKEKAVALRLLFLISF